MIDILTYPFMQRAFISGTIIGLLCSIIGIYIVMRGLSFIGAGISHASFGGVALGFLLKINPIITAAIFCILTAWGITIVSGKEKLKEDTAIGIFFATTMALGILFIGLTGNYNVDLFGYLFGSILSVGAFDLYISILLGLLILLLIVMFFKEFLFISFDPEGAEVSGLPVSFLRYLLLTLIALTIVLSMKIVGIILVSALLVIPAASAYQIAKGIRSLFIWSGIFCFFAVYCGLFLSYIFDTPSGATIVILSAIVFFLILLVKSAIKIRKS
ncbi:MAG: metal ABC transporter permease [Candidatus Coatesbacteria bacterium]|nr:metal ABC transporter permease [Candidatus Coatesbacteria bacterium]